ncbi:hypothetical protein KJZ71_02065 [Patescibacteria group bacterium]|uniref:Uncharacterized protein n=1 Tax=candidate division WWE3 bacterium TaxID=2053526 RepID=A0A928TQH9_UNCKA|nr:hypothetical protein [candidate division WWE3 bacterium]MCL4732572.1 hypothetical protein [Patescibacteria group bacterium]MDL1953239.1 hypothetical protein [Candidatus Uhrbacteria bacterium UHB]RIL00956.1 MAG: hypothetical protein DCC77_00215 [Candidatus Uhrbacteria bacterium]
MSGTLLGNRLYMSTNDPCPACGKRIYARVLVLNRTERLWILVEDYCASVQCQPAMRGSIPDLLIHGHPVLVPECFQVSLDLCRYCQRADATSIDRGNHHVAKECPGCDLLYVPRFNRNRWLRDDEPYIDTLDDGDIADDENDSGIRSKSPMPFANGAAGEKR